MLVKILGGIDVLGGLLLILTLLTDVPHYLLIFFGVILLFKSLLGFPKNFGGWVDFCVGSILLLCIFFSIPLIIKIILAFLIVQKGISSFL